MLFTCQQNVSKMSKCWRFSKNCVILWQFAQHRHKICSSNLCQVENQGQTHRHEDEQTSEKTFGSLLQFLCKNKNWYFFVFFYLSHQLYINKYFWFIWLLVITYKQHFTNHMWKVVLSQHHLWQNDSIFGLLPNFFTKCQQLVACRVLCQSDTWCRERQHVQLRGEI